jgi:hypothetical protein
MRQVVGKGKGESLPTLLFSEWLYVLEKCTRTYNEIPFKEDPENLYVCPQDLLNPSEGMPNIENTDSHLVSINEMVIRIKIYQEALWKARKEEIYADLKRLSNKSNKRSGGPDILLMVGDVIIFSPKNKFNATVFGKITEVGNQTVEFETRDKKVFRRPACLITPLIYGANSKD